MKKQTKRAITEVSKSKPSALQVKKQRVSTLNVSNTNSQIEKYNLNASDVDEITGEDIFFVKESEIDIPAIDIYKGTELEGDLNGLYMASQSHIVVQDRMMKFCGDNSNFNPKYVEYNMSFVDDQNSLFVKLLSEAGLKVDAIKNEVLEFADFKGSNPWKPMDSLVRCKLAKNIEFYTREGLKSKLTKKEFVAKFDILKGRKVDLAIKVTPYVFGKNKYIGISASIMKMFID